MLFILLLLPSLLLTQPHVLLTSNLKTIETSHPFHASIFPHDCFSDPCYYKIRTPSSSYYGQVTGQTLVKITTKVSGEQNIYVSLNDNNDQSNLFPVLSNNSLAPTSVIPINVIQAVSCHHMDFSINDTVTSHHNYEGEVELQIDILSPSGAIITPNYFYNSMRPVFTFDNGTISFQTSGVDFNKHWKVMITDEFLQNPGHQRAWLVRVEMPQFSQGGCTVHYNTLVISHLHPVHSANLGPSVEPVVTSSRLRYRQGPCSRNLFTVFQTDSEYFGISLDNLAKISWYNINSLPGLALSNASIFDISILKAYLIISTSQGIITHTAHTNTLTPLTATHSTLFAPSFCPAHTTQQVVAVVDSVVDSAAYVATEPYTAWTTLELNVTQLSGDWPLSTLKHVFYDSLWDSYIYLLANTSSLAIQSQSVSGKITQSPVQTDTDYRGTFFHSETSYLFVYGEKIFFSKVRGGAALAEKLDLGTDVVIDMSYCSMSGDIVAVTEGGSVYLSNIALVRFTQLHSTTTTLTPLLTFYTFDHHTHLNLYTVNSTDLTPNRYGLPTRSLMNMQHQPSPVDLTLNIMGKHKLHLTAKGQPGVFTEADIGKVITSRDGGLGRIYSYDDHHEDGVDYSIALVNTIAYLPYAVTDYSNSSLAVAEVNETHYYLTLPVAKEWYVSDVGRNVHIFFCTSYSIIAYVNATTVLSEADHPEQACVGSHTHWILTNWAAHSPVISISGSDNAEIASSTATGYVVTVSFADKSDLTGLILRLGDRAGVVQSHDSSAQLIMSSYDSFTVGETFTAEQLTLHQLAAGSLADLESKPTWSIRENSCYHTFFLHEQSVPSNVSQPLDRAIRYIDTNEEEFIHAEISAFKFTDIEEELKLQVYFDNREEFNFSMEAHSHNHLMELEVHLEHEQHTGGVYTPLVVSSNMVSLQCEVPVLLYQLNRGCNTHRTLHIRYPGDLTPKDFLYYSPKDSNGNNMIIDLPVNYRPPSTAGIAIPTSTHVYNADPSKPMDTEHYNVSKHSYHYKQCKDKVDAENCGCGDYERLSDLTIHSDCKQRVYQLFYTDVFIPDLYLREFGQDYIHMNKPYVITELNGREGYKASALSVTEAGTTNYSISFFGTGLFHFHVSVISGTICAHETEFIVFIVQPPLSTTNSNVITAITGFCIALVILLFFTLCMSDSDTQVVPRKGSSQSKRSLES